MTLQQLEYIIAVADHRHFVRAAKACGVTQSTLSSMIRKLEEELDLTIFDRASHPVTPTLAGETIISQARKVLFQANRLREMTLSEQHRAEGMVRLGVTPTIAPYIVPQLFCYIDSLPKVDMKVGDHNREKIIRMLKNAELDMAIMSLPKKDDVLLEIPLYRERFFAYVSPRDPLFQQQEVCSRTMPLDRLWALSREICFQMQVSEFCDQDSQRVSRYETGSISTLLFIVNQNGGFTVVPELHIHLLRSEDVQNLRPLVDPVPVRQVSLFVRKDYVHEGLLNVIADGIKQIIPASMIDDHLAQFPVRLY